jgi:hypothetical protein
MENVNKFIEVWVRNEDSLHESFGTAYNYALYLCGGDFTQFDDINSLVAFLSTTRIVPSPEYQSKYNKEDSDDLPF